MIINSLLDTDLYKLTMMQSALHQFPTVEVEYEFRCRNEAVWTEEIVSRIRSQINAWCGLRFTPEELDYLRTIRFFKKDFVDFLKFYQPNKNHVRVYFENNELKIKVKGPWYLTILFEVPVLAIVNEVYFMDHSRSNSSLWKDGWARIDNKYDIAEEKGFSFADFGTRRRFSFYWQDACIQTMKKLPNFIGTSNVYFAKKYNLKPVGTMAHEYIMVGQGLENVSLRNSQKAMLQSWVDEYRGDLGIALSDTLGIDAFLKDFDLYFAKLYDGLRHDSGDPYEWAKKVIKHYRKLGINPKTKTLVFSDGLTFEKAAEISNDGIAEISNVRFGIGTNLTNDFEEITPLQIVMKITECNGNPVAKISDSPGKGMCKDNIFLIYLKETFSIN